MIEPSWRKPFGILLMLVFIVVWSVGVIVVSPWVLLTPWPIQALFFTIAGIAWIFPLKPLLRWMEVGKWRE
jgi:hypothetical protein